MYDPHTKESRGFGFVMMYSPEDAQRVIEALNQREFNGKIMTVAHVSLGNWGVRLADADRHSRPPTGSTSSCSYPDSGKVLRTSQDRDVLGWKWWRW